MPKYIPCEECGEEAAIVIGGNGTDKSPWQWECSACEHVFLSNEYDPDADE